MAQKPKGFICFDGYLARTAKLSDQEVGRLFRACMLYHATGELTELAGRESVAFDFIREDIDAASQSYKDRCDKNLENIEKRWSDTNEYDRIRSNTIEENEIPNDTKHTNKNKNRIIKEYTNSLSDSPSSGETDGFFDAFWSKYPKKTKKPDARRAWEKLNPGLDILPEILEGLERWKESGQWQREGGRFIPYPATWLNGRQWEDEVPKEEEAPKKTVPAQQYTQRSYTHEDEVCALAMSYLGECGMDYAAAQEKARAVLQEKYGPLGW